MTAPDAPTKFPRTDYVGREGPNCRAIIPPARGGWSEPAIFEWELRAEEWTDEHPRKNQPRKRRFCGSNNGSVITVAARRSPSTPTESRVPGTAWGVSTYASATD